MSEARTSSHSAPMVQVRGLKMHFPIYSGLLHRTDLRLRRPNAGPADEGKSTV